MACSVYLKTPLFFIKCFLLYSFCSVVIADISYQVKGLNKALEANVRAHIGQINDSDWALRQHLQARTTVGTKSALEALGYYDSEVFISFNDKDKKMLVKVNKGKPVLWEFVNLELEGVGSGDQLLISEINKSAPELLSVLNHEDYEKFKRKIKIVLLERGYFDFEILNARLEIDRELHRANAVLFVNTGERYKIVEVTFSKSIIKEELLYKLINFDIDSPYLKTTVDEFYKSIVKTAYFNNIVIDKELDKELDKDQLKQVKLHVSLEDREPNRVTLGAGYGTDTGPKVKIGWEKPIINTDGHSFSSLISLSKIQKLINFSYKIPGGHPADNFFQLSAGRDIESFEKNDFTLDSIGVSRNHKFKSDWVRNIYLKVNNEQSEQENDLNETVITNFDAYVTPGLGFSHRVANRPLNPDQGYNFNFNFEFTDPALGSDTQYVLFRGATKGLYNFENNHSVLGRLELGYLISDEFFEVPLSKRFFAGGDQSIRGYDYKSLSPESSDGTLTGGEELAVVSTEYLWRFKPKWKIALFVDHGIVGLDSGTSAYTGIGVGVRWLSMVGNIQLDLASRINSDESGLKLHLFMGPVL